MAITSDNIPLSDPIPDGGRVGDWLAAAAHPRIADLLAAAAAPNTRRAYESDLRLFRAWGGSVPAARYLAHHARTLSVATLARRLVAIRRAHAWEGHGDPTASALVRQTFRGLRRAYGRPQRRLAPLLAGELAAIVSSLGSSIKDVRDQALLLVGFAGAFRRSELSAVVCTAIEWTQRGIIVSLPRSKTDQEWRGRKVGIPCARGPICTVAALRSWLDASGVTGGPVFRPVTKAGRVLTDQLSGDAIARIVKQRVAAIGLNPTLYSGHSLRAGFTTSAAVAGVPTWKIKMQTGHASDAVLNGYVRQCDLLDDNAAGQIL